MKYSKFILIFFVIILSRCGAKHEMSNRIKNDSLKESPIKSVDPSSIIKVENNQVIDTIVYDKHIRISLPDNHNKVFLFVNDFKCDSMFYQMDKDASLSKGLVLKSNENYQFNYALCVDSNLFISSDAFPSHKILLIVDLRVSKFLQSEALLTISSYYGGFLFNGTSFYISDSPNQSGEDFGHLIYHKMKIINGKLIEEKKFKEYWSRDCLDNQQIFESICHKLVNY